MSRPKDLYDLQQIDSQLDRINARLKEIAAILADDQAVRQAQGEADKAAQHLAEAQKQLQQARQIVQAQRTKIQQEEDKLYSGRVVNPKELSDLQNEVAALKRHLDTLEERQIEAMLLVDETSAVNERAQQKLEAVKAESAQRNQTLIAEREALLTQRADLETRRQKQSARLTAEDRELYERLRTTRGRIAVARVQERTCAACGSTLISATRQQARSPSSITLCDTCGRILYSD